MSNHDKIVLDFDMNNEYPTYAQDLQFILRIVIGCTKYVYQKNGPKSQWRKKALKLKKLSTNELAYLCAWKYIDSEKDANFIFRPKSIESRFKEYVRDVDQPTISKSLDRLRKAQIIEKCEELSNHPGKPRKSDTEKIPGPKSFYKKYENPKIHEVVTCVRARWVIFSALYESDVLLEFLKHLYYSNHIRIKYSETDDLLNIDKAKQLIPERMLVIMQQLMAQSKSQLLSLTDTEVMTLAFEDAKRHLTKSDWKTDEDYTTFFKLGFRFYSHVDASNLQYYKENNLLSKLE